MFSLLLFVQLLPIWAGYRECFGERFPIIPTEAPVQTRGRDIKPIKWQTACRSLTSYRLLSITTCARKEILGMNNWPSCIGKSLIRKEPRFQFSTQEPQEGSAPSRVETILLFLTRDKPFTKPLNRLNPVETQTYLWLATQWRFDSMRTSSCFLWVSCSVWSATIRYPPLYSSD